MIEANLDLAPRDLENMQTQLEYILRDPEADLTSRQKAALFIGTGLFAAAGYMEASKILVNIFQAFHNPGA